MENSNPPLSPRHKPFRHILPTDRAAIVHYFDIGGYDGHLIVGHYENGEPGELFIDMKKEGSTISGFADVIAVLTSLCLQYNVPLEVLVDKMEKIQFEPSGITPNKNIPYAKSLVDYIFKWFKSKYLSHSCTETTTNDSV